MSAVFFFLEEIFCKGTDALLTEKLSAALLPIIDNVLNSYLALCQSQPHCWGLLVPANFHEIVEDAEDIQQFANHNRFVGAVAKPAAAQVRRTADWSL
jgi:hypothetical protein